MRILITGGPKTGKTTAADSAGVDANIPVRHTDDLIGKLDWSASSLKVSEWIVESDNWIIEGVAVPRALRKWLAANPEGKPADLIIYLHEPRIELSDGQRTMGKGVLTVWSEILPDLIARGCDIKFGDA